MGEATLVVAVVVNQIPSARLVDCFDGQDFRGGGAQKIAATGNGENRGGRTQVRRS